MIELIHGDCMDYLKGCSENQFDLCIADPPYGISADIKNSTSKKQSKKSASHSKKYGFQQWDNDIPTKEVFLQMVRTSKNQVIWGVNYYPYDFLCGGRIYWNKCVTMPTYSDGELAYCSLINSLKSVKIAWHGMIQQDMKNKQTRIHPTEKPIQLYRWILQNYAKKGDTILDTHGGSMSIAIACYIEGFDLVCIEKDKDYFDAAKKRYEDYISMNPNLFEPEDLRPEIKQGELF